MAGETVINLKVDKDLCDAFMAKAHAVNKKGTDMLRDMMKAFVNGQLTITPTDEQLELFGIQKEK